MNAILLIPAAVAAWWIFRFGTPSALRNVYIPVLFLFPLYFQFILKGLPPIDDAQAIMFVFGLAILLHHRAELYFSSTDLWIGIFVYGILVSETLHTDLKTGIYQLVGDIGSALLPYLCGKLLIEQYGQRTAMVKRICWLLVIVSIGSLYEYRFARNPYRDFLSPFFHGQGATWILQMRWGRARISGPYGHAIIAGMMFLTGVLFNLWMLRFHKWEPTFKHLRFRWAPKGAIIMFWLLVGTFITQSRGPWLGLGFGFAVSLVGFARNTKRAFFQFVVLAGLVFSMAYPFFNSYTSGTTATAHDIDQENAVYRRMLIDSYTPVIQAGGLWGWGVTQFPVVNKQISIDNEYLFLGVTRGYLGLSVFLVLIADALFTLIRTGIRFHNREDRLFAFCMVGVLAGLLFAIGTVYLGNQMYEMLFLILGWSQAIGKKRPTNIPAFRQVIA
ncbi:MAG TPA: O-antigen ligase family protein [Acidobacteriaceae bacterium]